MKKIAIIGGAGAPNYGDEIIVKGWISYFKENARDAEVVFYENIAANERQLHCETPEIRFSDDLVKIAKNFQGIGFWEQVIRGYRFIENDGVGKYSMYDLTPLMEADIVHLHGGGYLNDYDPIKGFYLGLLASLKEKRGCMIIATGIGFGPVSDPPEELIAKLKHIWAAFDFFELRDVDNFRALSSMFPSANTIYGLDDCYLNPIESLVVSDESKKRLFLSMLDYNIRKIEESFWSALIDYSKNFDEIIFIESYPWQDRNVLKFLREKIGPVGNLDIHETMKNGIRAGSGDFVICSRFHVHFVLSRAGINGLYSKDTSYYSIKHQSIVDLGSKMKFCDLRLFEQPQSGRSFIAMRESALRAQKLQLIDSVYKSSQ
jgi:hypothetical protein